MKLNLSNKKTSNIIGKKTSTFQWQQSCRFKTEVKITATGKLQSQNTCTAFTLKSCD